MTTTNSINWFLTAGTLRAAFTQKKRDDGASFWCLTEQARQSVDDLTSFIRELHDDEMPNDWRYETIVDICTYLMDLIEPIDEQSDASDIAFSTAAVAADVGIWKINDCPVADRVTVTFSGVPGSAIGTPIFTKTTHTFCTATTLYTQTAERIT